MFPFIEFSKVYKYNTFYFKQCFIVMKIFEYNPENKTIRYNSCCYSYIRDEKLSSKEVTKNNSDVLAPRMFLCAFLYYCIVSHV